MFPDADKFFQIPSDSEAASNSEKVKRVDRLYERLQCEIERIDPGTDYYDAIVKYISNTKQDCKYTVKAIFKVGKGLKHPEFVGDALDNHKLLWHGSRISNFSSILKSGLRIAPNHAPSSGRLFGNGLYFADFFAKASQYCRYYSSDNEGMLLLCEVALGKSLEQSNISLQFHN
jgi:hypothetical protein